MFADFSFANQRVVILGLARQGLALARFFCDAGANVTVSDRASADALQSEIEQLANLPINFVLDGHPLSLLDECDLLCLSGGVPPQIEIVQTAIQRGIPLSNDVLLTMQIARTRGLGPIVAITGSSGKTTTTTLVGEMLSQMGHRVHVGGNIGVPLLDKLSAIHVGEFTGEFTGEFIVLELSSFQLELFDPVIAWDPFGESKLVGPDVAAIVNITPNHLDRHADMAAYTSAKLNLLRHLPESATVVVNADDPVVSRLTIDSNTVDHQTADPPAAEWALDEMLADVRELLASSKVTPFSREQSLATGASIKETESETALVCNGGTICQRSDLRLRGAHNVSNVLAAAAISDAAAISLYSKTGYSKTGSQKANNAIAAQTRIKAMRNVARTFAGVPHRLEVVAESDNVQWINDSIATSPERTLAGLHSFEPDAQTLILLAGGKDKNLSWESLAEAVNQRVDHLIGFGEVGATFVELVQEQARFARIKAPNTAVVARLEQAVILANQFARSSKARAIRSHARAETNVDLPIVVLLSPGGTSYDAYKDFEERGDHFRTLVANRLTTDQGNDLRRKIG